MTVSSTRISALLLQLPGADRPTQTQLPPISSSNQSTTFESRLSSRRYTKALDKAVERNSSKISRTTKQKVEAMIRSGELSPEEILFELISKNTQLSRLNATQDDIDMIGSTLAVVAAALPDKHAALFNNQGQPTGLAKVIVEKAGWLVSGLLFDKGLIAFHPRAPIAHKEKTWLTNGVCHAPNAGLASELIKRGFLSYFGSQPTQIDKLLLQLSTQPELELEVVKKLIGAGANPAIRDSNDRQLTHMAANCGSPELLNYLLGYKQGRKLVFNKDERDQTGLTPMMHTLENELHGNELFKLLMDQGADLNALTKHGFSALHMAIEYISADRLDRLLKALPADKKQTFIDLPGTGALNNATALDFAVSKDKLDIVKTLLSHGASIFPDRADNKDMTPAGALSLCNECYSNSNSIEIFDQILLHAPKEKIQKLDEKKSFYLTALEGRCSPKVFACLNRHNAAYRNQENKNLFDINCRVKIGRSTDNTLLMAVLKEISLPHKNEIVRELLKGGADISLADGLKQNAFHLAVDRKQLEVVKALLEQRPDPALIKAPNGWGNTPLGLAPNGSDIKRLLSAYCDNYRPASAPPTDASLTTHS